MTTLSEIKIGKVHEFIYNELDENGNHVRRWQKGVVESVSDSKIKTSNGVLWISGLIYCDICDNNLPADVERNLANYTGWCDSCIEAQEG